LVKTSLVVAPVTVPLASILPNAIVKPSAESISVTPTIVLTGANDCKFKASAGLGPPGPDETTCAGPLSLTLLPAAL